MNPNIIEGPEEYKKLISELTSDTPLDEIDYGDKVSVIYRGWAGHYIAADSCLFRLNSLLQYKGKCIVVSTVGNHRSNGKLDTIDYNRYYETMVFYSEDNDELYHDADVTKGISLKGKWNIDYFDSNTDNEANDMHVAAVREVAERLKSGEL